MEKTINIGNKEVRLTNNVSWAITYKDQFGRDILPTLMPMFMAALDIVGGVVEETGGGSEIAIPHLINAINGEKFVDAVIHLSGLEFTEFINITWAMAKACDDDIPEPKRWVRDFDEFPLDVVAPEVAKLAFKGLVSSKNLKRLKDLISEIKVVQPESTSTQLSSPDSNED